MFFGRGRFFRVLFAGFLFLALFGLFSRGAYRSGYVEGFNSGQATVLGSEEGSSADTAVPQQPQVAPSGVGHWHYGPFWFFGGLFKFFIFFLIFGGLMKMFMFRRWHHGRHHSHWKHHGGWPGHEQKEKSPEDVEPDIRTV